MVNQLYGAGLERMLDVLHRGGTPRRHGAGRPGRRRAGVRAAVGARSASLRRAAPGSPRALDSVRPYLGSHGGDVELLGVTDDGVVRLRLLGSCDSCPSSTVTLELAVEGAIQAAAPEVTSIEVDAPPAVSRGRDDPGRSPAGPARQPRRRAPTGPPTGCRCRSSRSSAVGELGGFRVDDVSLVAARLGGDVFAYRDHCPSCRSTLEGARLERRLGDSADIPDHGLSALPGPLRRPPRRRRPRLRPPSGAAADPAPIGRAERRRAGRPLRTVAMLSDPAKVSQSAERAVGPAPHHDNRPAADPSVATCDMCAEPIGDDHPHVVDIAEPAADVHLPGLPAVVHRRGCAPALSGGARPLPVLPRLHVDRPAGGTPSTSPSGWRSSSPAR